VPGDDDGGTGVDAAMSGDRTIVVIPAYNAGRTLERVWRDIPQDAVTTVIVVDDASTDDTPAVAARLPVVFERHDRNRGYGGNQKTCYDLARASDADFVVMIHGDYQYDARVLRVAVDILRLGICDVVLGNRIRTRREALAGGMPRTKYLANRALTMMENVMSGQNLGEWHSGFRAYSRAVLETIPYRSNSDGFVFDTQFLLQCVHFGFKLGDVPVPVRYFAEASSIGLGSSTVYALRTLATFGRWFAHRLGIAASPLFEAAAPAAGAAPPAPRAAVERWDIAEPGDSP
jgi:glycosyltransferase involved in cell wall biosynthesis